MGVEKREVMIYGRHDDELCESGRVVPDRLTMIMLRIDDRVVTRTEGASRCQIVCASRRSIQTDASPYRRSCCWSSLSRGGSRLRIAFVDQIRHAIPFAAVATRDR
jgi:hypothetical protein